MKIKKCIVARCRRTTDGKSKWCWTHRKEFDVKW